MKGGFPIFLPGLLILAVTGYPCHEPWTAEGGTRDRAGVSGGKGLSGN